jgi:hypothetical protein
MECLEQSVFGLVVEIICKPFVRVPAAFHYSHVSYGELLTIENAMDVVPFFKLSKGIPSQFHKLYKPLELMRGKGP